MVPRTSARRVVAPALLAALCVASPGQANTVVLTSSRDNTLIEVAAGNLSNALGDVFAGRVGNFGGGTRRRGLMRFDIAGNIPAGSTITSVTLTLSVLSAPVGNPPQTVSLHRALADWGEGTSFFPGGQGAPATTGDATWLHRFFNTTFWTTAGGDFNPVASASTSVGSGGTTATWGSTAQMVADAQTWLNDPANNFGWLIRGNESVIQTSRRFGSREEPPANQPVLTVQFNPPPCPWDCDDHDGIVDVTDFLALLSQWPGPGACDVNGNGTIDTVDFLAILSHWGPCP